MARDLPNTKYHGLSTTQGNCPPFLHSVIALFFSHYLDKSRLYSIELKYVMLTGPDILNQTFLFYYAWICLVLVFLNLLLCGYFFSFHSTSRLSYCFVMFNSYSSSSFF